VATAALKLVSANELVPANEPFGESRRESRRWRVMLAASMMTGAAEVAVIIRDISSTGALISTPVGPPVGSYVTLRRGEVCVVGQVVRRGGDKIALHFRDVIDEASLLVVIGRSTARSKH
jgi:hypothetical protein